MKKGCRRRWSRSASTRRKTPGATQGMPCRTRIWASWGTEEEAQSIFALFAEVLQVKSNLKHARG
eukprot:2568131-Lingulodinium_polyedra.AAC.1